MCRENDLLPGQKQCQPCIVSSRERRQARTRARREREVASEALLVDLLGVICGGGNTTPERDGQGPEGQQGR